MADKPILKVSAKLDKDSSRKQIQKSLDEIGKSLKVTIGVDKGNKSTVTTVKKETKQIISSLEQRKIKEEELLKLKRKAEAEHAEFAVKSFNSRQKIAKQEETLKLKLEKNIAKELADKEKIIAKYGKIENAVKTANEQVDKFGKKSHTNQMATLNKEFGKLKVSADMTSKELKEVVVQSERVKNSMNQVSQSARVTGKSALHMGEFFLQAAKSFSIWISVTSIFFATIRAFKEGIRTIVDLDTAFLELRKVSDLTTESFSGFVVQAQSVGATVGRTTTEVTKATAAFKRMGFTIDESLNLAEKALVLTNIGDGIDDVEQSTDVLISTLKGFGLEASKAGHVVDALNEVSNNFAVNTDDLAEGIRRVSSVMSATGDSMEETLGMLTAMNEVMQDSAKSATALRTLSLRIMGLDEDGKSLGKTFEARLGKTFQDVAGVSLTVEGRLKSMTQIVTDLGSVWGGLTKEQQLYLAQEAAGKRQAQGFIALLNNYETAIKATETAMNSQGSALIENEKYLDSISGKVALFSQALETLWTNAINSETIKTIVDFGTALIKVADGIGLVNTALIMLTGIFAVMKSGAIIKTLATTTILWGNAMGVATVVAGQLVAMLSTLLPYVAIGGAVVLGLVAINKAVDSMVTTQDEYNQMLLEYKTLIEKGSEISRAEFERLQSLERTIEANNHLSESYEDLSDTKKEDIVLTTEQVNAQNLLNEARKRGRVGGSGGRGGRRGVGIVDDIVETKHEEFVADQKLIESHEKLAEARKGDVALSLKQIEAFRELEKIQDEYNSTLDNFQSSASSIASVYDDINEGEKISATNILDLIQKYPEYASQIANINSNKEAGIGIAKTLFEIERSATIASIEGLKQEALAQQGMNEQIMERARLDAILHGSFDKYNKMVSESVKVSNKFNASIKVVEGLSLNSFINSTKDANDELKKFQDNIKDGLEEYMSDYERSIEREYNLFKQNEEDKFRVFEENQEKRIKAIDDEIDSLEKKRGSDDFADKEKDILDEIAEYQLKIEKSKIDNSVEANKIRLEDTENKGKLEDELEKLRTDRQFNLDKTLLEDKKKIIQEETSAEKKKYDAIVRDAERSYQTMKHNLEVFADEYEDKWAEIGLDSGESFSTAFKSAFDEIYNDMLSKLDSLSSKSPSKPKDKTSGTTKEQQDKFNIADTDKSNLKKYGEQWTKAQEDFESNKITEREKADTQAKAHAAAENVRAKYGFSGGEAGDKVIGLKSGGYTGDFSGGRLAMLHSKELVLNSEDTSNILKAVDIMRDATSAIKSPDSGGDNSVVIEIINQNNIANKADADYFASKQAREIEKAMINSGKVITKRR